MTVTGCSMRSFAGQQIFADPLTLVRSRPVRRQGNIPGMLTEPTSDQSINCEPTHAEHEEVTLAGHQIWPIVSDTLPRIQKKCTKNCCRAHLEGRKVTTSKAMRKILGLQTVCDTSQQGQMRAAPVCFQSVAAQNG